MGRREQRVRGGVEASVLVGLPSARAGGWGGLCYQTKPSGVMVCSLPKDLLSHSVSPPGTFVPEPGGRQSQLGGC